MTEQFITNEVDVRGHKFHMHQVHKADPLAWGNMIVSDEVIKKPDNGNLITGIEIRYVMSRDYAPNASRYYKTRVTGNVITNIADGKILDEQFSQFRPAGFMHEYRPSSGRVLNLSEGQAEFYRGIYPDFPVLTGSNDSALPLVKLNIIDVDLEREGASEFYEWLTFIAQGKLLSNSEIAAELAELATGTIPQHLREKIDGARSIESDATDKKPKFLPADHRAPGTRGDAKLYLG